MTDYNYREEKKARIIAFYLPQFHPIPENDMWWGKGFTEWTNVALAKPLFRGHYQPHIPADLGFYDLRLAETREAQAELAKEAGIEGFCYWHYWFGEGKRLLETPFNAVLESGRPDFPFCLAWANHSWSNSSWKKGKHWLKDGIIAEQKYLGEKDYTDHFYAVLNAFKDKRYITVDLKPVFVVFSPLAVPDMKYFISLWQDLAKKNGLKGIHFVGVTNSAPYRQIGKIGTGKFQLPNIKRVGEYYNYTLGLGFDAINSHGIERAMVMDKGRYNILLRKLLKRYLKINILEIYKQSRINKYLLTEEDKWENVYPSLFSNWDRTPRSGKKAEVFINSTPEHFKDLLKKTLKIIDHKQDDHKIVFIRSWNEWGEGNYIEPDLKYGKKFLDAIKEILQT